jgi:hypothetical protein
MNPCFYEDVPLLKITTEEQSLYVQASRYRGLLLLVANRVLNNSDDAESAVKASSPVVIRPTEPGSGVATEGLPRLGIPTKPSAIPEGYSSTSCRIRATKSPRVCYTEYFATQNAEHPIRMRVFYNPFPIPPDCETRICAVRRRLPGRPTHHNSFSPSWICREVVAVEVITPAVGDGSPVVEA